MTTNDDGLGALNPIDLALLEYFKERAPFVAIMLEGAWGAGKTHFLRERGQRLARRAEKSYVSLSVAGLQTRGDLERALFFAATPILDNGYAEALGIFTRAAMRWAKIDPGELKPKADLSAGKIVVVVDDVERFAGDLRVAFGFVVDLVDCNGLHVVVVASEEKLLARNTEVGEWKEKVVGRTIKLIPSESVMVDTTLDGLANRAIADKMKALRPSLVTVLSKSKLASFRAVKFSLHEVAKVIEALGERFDELGSAREVLVDGILIGLLELKRDASNLSQIAKFFGHSDLGVAYQAVALQADHKADVSNADPFIRDIFSRYDGTGLLLFPGGKVVSEFFEKGVLEAAALAELFTSLKQQAAETVAPSVLTGNVFEMPQDAFDTQTAALEESLRNGEFRSVGMVARIYVAMKYWSERRLIGLSASEVADLCIAAIRAMPEAEVVDRHADTDVFWFQRQQDAHDLAVTGAIEDKVAAALSAEIEVRRAQVRAALRSSDQALGDLKQGWALTPLFVGSAQEWAAALREAAPSQIQEVLALMGRRTRFADSEQHLEPEHPVLRELAGLLEANLPTEGRLSLAQSQVLALVLSFRVFVHRFEQRQAKALAASPGEVQN